jgi:hypothetical protein
MIRLRCCVYGCPHGRRVKWWRALWAMAMTLSPRPYICAEHRRMFQEGP